MHDRSASIQAIVEAQQQENARVERALREKRKQAQLFGRTVAQAIAEKDPQVELILGFGSVYDASRPFHEGSDLDLGIAGGQVWKYERLIPRHPGVVVSFLDLDSCSPVFVEAVKASGVILYAKNSP